MSARLPSGLLVSALLRRVNDAGGFGIVLAKGDPQGGAILDHVLSCSAVGGPAKVAREIAAFVARTGVDELMIASSIYDHEARKRSLTITAQALQDLAIAA